LYERIFPLSRQFHHHNATRFFLDMNGHKV
jgi:hypothetical protein